MLLPTILKISSTSVDKILAYIVGSTFLFSLISALEKVTIAEWTTIFIGVVGGISAILQLIMRTRKNKQAKMELEEQKLHIREEKLKIEKLRMEVDELKQRAYENKSRSIRKKR